MDIVELSCVEYQSKVADYLVNDLGWNTKYFHFCGMPKPEGVHGALRAVGSAGTTTTKILTLKGKIATLASEVCAPSRK